MERNFTRLPAKRRSKFKVREDLFDKDEVKQRIVDAQNAVMRSMPSSIQPWRKVSEVTKTVTQENPILDSFTVHMAIKILCNEGFMKLRKDKVFQNRQVESYHAVARFELGPDGEIRQKKLGLFNRCANKR